MRRTTNLLLALVALGLLANLSTATAADVPGWQLAVMKDGSKAPPVFVTEPQPGIACYWHPSGFFGWWGGSDLQCVNTECPGGAE